MHKLCESKLTSITVDSVRLTVILGYFMMNEAYNVGPDWCLEYSRKAHGGISGLVLFRVDGDQRTRSGQRLKNINIV